MTSTLIYKLQIITLLDSICFGLTYPFLSTHIQSLGADHVVVGILSVGYLLCSLVSKDIVQLLKIRERQFGLVILLFITALTHLSLIVTNNYWVVIFGRYVYSIVANHCQNICKALLIKNAESRKKDNILTAFSIASGSGYIIGPIVAGFLFEKGFLYIGILAALLMVISICLAITIHLNTNASKDDCNVQTVLEKINQNISNTVNDCRNSNGAKNWDIMTIKYLHVSCVMIFYGKFSQILKHNYQSTPVIVGSTYAYMNGMTLASTYYTAMVKEKYTPFSPIIVAEKSFKCLGVCLLVACYSPCYSMYMVTCIPIVFINTLIDSVFKDLCGTRQEDAVGRLIGPLKIGAGMTTPIVFGILCNIVGHHAVIMFSVIPTILSVFIINRYTNRSFSEDTDKKNE